MSSLKKLSLWLVPLVFLSLFPILLNAQDNMGKQSMSVTGCLKQGTDTGGYYIVANGKMYEVMAHGVNLAEHVGHTVTVTGHGVKLPEARRPRRKPAKNRKLAAVLTRTFRATSLKMVSTNCSQ